MCGVNLIASTFAIFRSSIKTRFKHPKKKKVLRVRRRVWSTARTAHSVQEAVVSHGCASNPALRRPSLSARCQRDITAMASYDISGDAPIKIEASPALDCIAQIEKLKAEGAALAKANKWDEAMAKYGEVVEACVASMGTA